MNNYNYSRIIINIIKERNTSYVNSDKNIEVKF